MIITICKYIQKMLFYINIFMEEKGYSEYKLIVSHECWRSFCIKYPDFKSLGMDYWTVRRILSDLSDLIIREVINSPLGFQLPYHFGCLRMIGNIPKCKRNFTTKLKNIDYYRTDGYVYGMRWLKQRAKIKNIRFYGFTVAKLIQRHITQCIREDKFFNWTKTYSLYDSLKITC